MRWCVWELRNSTLAAVAVYSYLWYKCLNALACFTIQFRVTNLEVGDMSRTSAGCAVGLVVVGVTCPGIGLFLASITGIAWLGDSIGEHGGLVTAYVAIGIIASYVAPALAIVAIPLAVRSFMAIGGVLVGAIVYMLAASLFFAIPSSFIAQSACKAGNDKAVWVMRIVPVVWGTEAAFAKPGTELSCVDGHLKGGGG